MIPCRSQVWKPSARAERLWAEQLHPRMEKNGHGKCSDTEKLMLACNMLTFGHPCLYEFVILTWQQWWGGNFALESRGKINTWAVRMVKALCEETMVNFMGCGAGGKSKIAGAYVYTRWKLKPINTSCFVSSTSYEALDSRIWGYIKDWHKTDSSSVGKRIESRRIITLDEEARDDDGTKDRDYRNGVKGVAIKTGQEGRNAIATIVGRHNKHVIWCYDEMCFMEPALLEGRNNIATNQFSQCIGLGNAPKEGDPLYIDGEPHGTQYPDGWRSIDKDSVNEWPTRSGRCFYFNGAWSPNFQAPANEPALFPGLMDESFRLKVLKTSGGEDTPGYWTQFYGFPPGVDISDKLLTMKLLEENGAFAEPVWMNNEKKVLGGLDLGFRADGDPCVLQFLTLGQCSRKNEEGAKWRKLGVLERDGIRLVPSQRSPDAFEVQIAKLVIKELRARGCRDLALDVTGDGGIMLQHIEREARAQGYALNILPVSFSGTAEDRKIIPGDARTGREMFQNMVAQLWGSLRMCVLNRALLGMERHSQCVGQLCARKMGTDDKKRTTVEPKKEMKKRLKRSPDHGDACALVVFLALRHGLAGQEVEKKKEVFDPQKMVRGAQGGRGVYAQEHRSIYGRKS